MREKAIRVLLLILSFIMMNCSGASWGEEKPKLDVPYEPTAYEIAREMLKLADVRKDDLVYDLGCGDGRLVIMAAKERGARGVGVDIDPERIRESTENAKKAGVTGLATFYQQDLFKTDFRDATVVMLYLWPEVNLRLRPALFAQLKPGTRVVSHSHTMGDWKPDKTSQVSNHTLYFWVIPADAAGTWTWSMPGDKASLRAVLQLKQDFQELKGSLTLGSATVPLTPARLSGNHLSLRVESEIDGQKTMIRLDGKVSDDTLIGTMELSGSAVKSNDPWKAVREKGHTH